MLVPLCNPATVASSRSIIERKISLREEAKKPFKNKTMKKQASSSRNVTDFVIRIARDIYGYQCHAPLVVVSVKNEQLKRPHFFR